MMMLCKIRRQHLYHYNTSSNLNKCLMSRLWLFRLLILRLSAVMRCWSLLLLPILFTRVDGYATIIEKKRIQWTTMTTRSVVVTTRMKQQYIYQKNYLVVTKQAMKDDDENDDNHNNNSNSNKNNDDDSENKKGNTGIPSTTGRSINRIDNYNDNNKRRNVVLTEEEVSKRLFQRLNIFDTIGKATNVVLYSFVIIGILLNIFGYAYVPKINSVSVSADTSNNINIPIITIGTMEERQFQMAIKASITKQKQKQNLQQQQQQEQQKIEREQEQQQ